MDRLRTLYAPNARMIWTGVGAEGTARLRNWSVEEYITAAGPGLMAEGFYELEIGRTTESFGNVTHVMSAYDSRFKAEDPKPFQRREQHPALQRRCSVVRAVRDEGQRAAGE